MPFYQFSWHSMYFYRLFFLRGGDERVGGLWAGTQAVDRSLRPPAGRRRRDMTYSGHRKCGARAMSYGWLVVLFRIKPMLRSIVFYVSLENVEITKSARKFLGLQLLKLMKGHGCGHYLT